jgi:hypothetical protein
MSGRRHVSMLVLLALALSGCGKNEGATPAACLDGTETYLSALKSAPSVVRLSGSTLISQCLRRGQAGGELGSVGGALVEAATRLNHLARKRPGGADTVRLGYLIGAVQRGAAGTSGIHSELVRRLDSAARFNAGGPFPLRFERAFGRGYATGRDRG